MKYSQFDRATLKAIRNDIDAVLQKYGNSSNINFTIGNIRFSAAECDIKIKATISGAKTQSSTLLDSKIKQMGLVAKNKRGEQLIEYKQRNHKYPFIYQNAANKRFKCSEAAVISRFSA